MMDVTAKVKKPIEAIQCVNTFSLLQRKMYNVLLANAAGNLYPDMTHRIAMRILCRLMGYRSNDYKTIKEKFRELRRMDIEWDVINEDGNKVWTNTSPLSLARVIEGEGVCEYEFTPSLVPFLDRPAQYAKFSLAVQAKFKSCYGLALYENCERYKKIGQTRAFDIATFRKLMGVGKEEYIDFFALKRRVVSIAVKEVNQYADFEVEPEYQKKGRNVVGIRFLIHVNNKSIEHDEEQATEPSADAVLMEKVNKYFGLSGKDTEKYLKKYGYAYLNEKVDTILNSDSFKKGLIKSMAGYLKTALAQDFKPNVTSQMAGEKQRNEEVEADQLKQKRNGLLSQLQEQYDNYLSNCIIEKILPELIEENKAQLLGEFAEIIAKSYYHDLYKREGFNNIIIRDRFVEFMKNQNKKLLQALVPFENYVKEYHAEMSDQIEVLDTLLEKRLKTV